MFLRTSRLFRFFHSSSVVSSIEIKMPSLSPTMTEGSIVQWYKKEGEALKAGDVLCEIQTDKAVMSLEFDDEGTLAKIIQNANSGNIPVGQLIALVAEEGENPINIQVNDKVQKSSVCSTESSLARRAEGTIVGVEIKMPSLSPTMTEGSIVQWFKKEGEAFSAGDVLCEIQTDKAVVALEADDDGILAKILVTEGSQPITIGTLIGLFVDSSSVDSWSNVQLPSSSSQEILSESLESGPSEKMGPASSRLLSYYGIVSDSIVGSGPKGMITKNDVVSYIESHKLSPVLESHKDTEKKDTIINSKISSSKKSESPSSIKKLGDLASNYTDHPLSSMRSVIASRLASSKRNSPHGYSSVSCNLNKVIKLRERLYSSAGIKVSLNDFIIKATGMTLHYVPEINLNISGEDFRIMPNIDVSVAVATDSGLITPIVKDVNFKSLSEISESMKDLAGRARKGKLTLNEFQGGTFTVSNLGMYGITEFTAIINPPQVGILSIGSGLPEIDSVSLKEKKSMRVTLSFDRRFVDEALAADFTSTFQRVIENPEFLNLDLSSIVRQSKMLTHCYY